MLPALCADTGGLPAPCHVAFLCIIMFVCTGAIAALKARLKKTAWQNDGALSYGVPELPMLSLETGQLLA